MMEAAQAKANKEKLPITDNYVQALDLQALSASNKYDVNTRKWVKLPAQEQTWTQWKKHFCAAYAAKQRVEKSRDSVDKPFGVAVEAIPMEDSLPERSNKIMDSLASYLDNIAAAANKNASAQGGPLAELADSMDFLVDTNTVQAKELEKLEQEVNALKKRNVI